LVTATGAGANSRRSIGIAVFSGILASTCLAVLFVPSFFAVLQRLREGGRKGAEIESLVRVPMASPKEPAND
jgi:hydrophobic/amphiphilic exporter-1 (mainly G- bacteria), HAE1 family